MALILTHLSANQISVFSITQHSRYLHVYGFDTPPVEWPYIQLQPMKESYNIISTKFEACKVKRSGVISCTRYERST